MTVAVGYRLCPTCGEIIRRDPPCETCLGREAGAQGREFGPCWEPAADVRQSYEDEMGAAVGL